MLTGTLGMEHNLEARSLSPFVDCPHSLHQAPAWSLRTGPVVSIGLPLIGNLVQDMALVQRAKGIGTLAWRSIYSVKQEHNLDVINGFEIIIYITFLVATFY